MTPRTAAGQRLGVDLEGMLGLQFKSREMYHAFLRDAEYLAVAIEDEAARDALVALRKKVDERLRGRVIGNYAEVTEQQDWMAEGMSFARNAVLALIDAALLSEVPQ